MVVNEVNTVCKIVHLSLRLPHAQNRTVGKVP